MIFACNVINVRLSSAHCITNQCYHSKFKCNHVQKRQTCTESGSLFYCCPGRDSGEKKKLFFHLRIYKYLRTYTVHSGKRNVCIYFNKRNTLLFGLNRNILLDKHIWKRTLSFFQEMQF